MKSIFQLLFAAAAAVVMLTACQKETPAPPSGHVHLLKAGDLTEAMISSALGGGKDLKITGAMGDADFATLLKWATAGLTNPNADLLHSLDLNGVTGLTAVPQYGCTSIRSLRRIDLPTTVTSVGTLAFSDCASLAEFTAPELQTVETMAFANCRSLTKFTAPKLQTVETMTFNYCSSLTEFTAPELQAAPDYAFSNCSSLFQFAAPKLTSIGMSAFSNCPALIKLRLTAKENITLAPDAFITFNNSINCTLYLHQNKKNGGSGTPAVAADGKTWGDVAWKEIIFVDDAGAPVL